MMLKKLHAEALGTFTLVFAGTGAIIINETTGGTVTHVGIALTFGLTVMAMIYAIGDVSGAHINPAVTLGFFLARRLPVGMVLPYMASQLVGAVAGSLVLRLLFSANVNLGATNPLGSPLQSFVLEVIMTWLLMFVILSVSAGAKEKGVTAGIAVGSVIALEALFGGPISGASMNPARSLAPALVSGQFEYLWVYVLAPAVGALLAVPSCRAVHDEGCCKKPGKELCAT